VKDKEGKEKRYPIVSNVIAEVQARSGNSVSPGALATLSFWGIDCVFLTQRGNPAAMLRSFSDDSHVKTRICQYESLSNGKGLKSAKQFVLGKLRERSELLHELYHHLVEKKDLEMPMGKEEKEANTYSKRLLE
jgi:CRISPR/Cas system-associated endonuclease Cas1